MLEALQIIWEVISREPDPNTVQFIEPFTLMAASAAAQGLGSIIKGRQQKKAAEALAEQQRQAAEQAKLEADTQIADALAKEAEYGLAPSYNELRKTVMEDPMADLQRQEALRTQAQSVEALRGGGARALLGGLSQVDETTADTFSKIAAEESARRKAGLQTIGGAEARVAEGKFGAARADLASARGLREEALGAEAGADAMDIQADLAGKQAVTSGITDMVSTGLGMAAQYGDFGGGGGGSAGQVLDTSSSPTQIADVQVAPPVTPNVNVFGQEVLDAQGNNLGFQGSNPYNFEEGGMIPDDEERMMIMAMEGALLRGETPGEFSHDNNPIDIMQDGAKIGEMTGGEGIVSPEDMGEMEQLAGKGNTPLHKFVRGWFKKINSKKNG